jgi:hypothetical protein
MMACPNSGKCEVEFCAHRTPHSKSIDPISNYSICKDTGSMDPSVDKPHAISRPLKKRLAQAALNSPYATALNVFKEYARERGEIGDSAAFKVYCEDRLNAVDPGYGNTRRHYA